MHYNSASVPEMPECLCLDDIIASISISLLDVACNDGSSEVREIALVSLRLLCRNPSCREVRLYSPNTSCNR